MGVIGDCRKAEAREQLARTQAVAAQMVIQDTIQFLRDYKDFDIKPQLVLDHIEAARQVYGRLVTEQESICADLCSRWG